MNAMTINPLDANASLLSGAGLLASLKLRTEAQVIAARFAASERLSDGRISVYRQCLGLRRRRDDQVPVTDNTRCIKSL